jgi:hypothetical protein
MKKLKKPVFILCVVLVGLCIYSCSDFLLPKRVEIKGTVSFPAKIGISNLSTRLITIMTDIFSVEGEGSKPSTVYGVDYDEQTVQAFCIHFPIEMTQNLHPDHFLKTINRQLNNGLSDDPKKLYLPTPSTGGSYTEVDLLHTDLADIAEVSLDEIAAYVISIEFDVCTGIDSGIGLNFYFEEIAPGMVMTLKCAELGINETKPLYKGDNIFGNSKALTGNDSLYMEGADGVKTLKFEVILQSSDPGNPNTLRINTPPGLNPGDMILVYDGEMRFFQNWTTATIDMEAAIIGQDDSKGVFPNPEYSPFDLSPLGDYFYGFTFEGIESMLYMNSSPIRNLEPILRVDASYGSGKIENLYYGPFDSGAERLVLEDGFIDGKTYTRKHLPGIADNMSGYNLDKNIMRDIFAAMPDNLRFTFFMDFHKDRYLVIYPDTFAGESDSDDHSRIDIDLLIMLPMHLKAIEDGSTVSIPDMFYGYDDLLGRKKPGEFFSSESFPSMDIHTLKMGLEFFEPMFFGGSLFLDGSKDIEPRLFYPNGIPLDNKGISVSFPEDQLDILRDELIKPNIWMLFKKNNEIFVPKNLGVMSIKFEMRGIIETGELFE